MLKLLEEYSITQIIVFIIIFMLGVKDLLSTIDWFKKRSKDGYDEENEQKNENEKLKLEIKRINQDIVNLSSKLDETNNHMVNVGDKISLLVDTNKDTIKSYITKEYHYFVEQKKWIDKFSFDCIEKMYSHYKDMNGNSFVKDLMDEIRELPKSPPNDKD